MNQFRAEVRNLDNRGLLGSAIASGIGNDGVPNFDASFPAGSQIRGVTTTNFVDLPVVGTVPISTYTGLDNPNAPADTSSDDNDVVPPVANPMTGTSQCPDGYTFDEDLQACRRKTKRELQADSGCGIPPPLLAICSTGAPVWMMRLQTYLAVSTLLMRTAPSRSPMPSVLRSIATRWTPQGLRSSCNA